MQYKIKPYPHQLHGIEMARKLGNIGLLWEMGSGKTGGIINILRDVYASSRRMKRTLILSPLVTLNNWKDEFRLHSYMNLNDIHVLSKGGTRGKLKLFNKFSMNKHGDMRNQDCIFITNYETMNNEVMLKAILEWEPEVIILDEAHYIKNPKAKRSKAIIKIGLKAVHKYISTGTPILNDVRDIFNLFLFLDNGATFGKNFYVFQSIYMEDENAAWANNKGHFKKLVTRTDTYADLSDKVYTRCHRVLTKDVLKDLPPLVHIVRKVELSPEQRRHYKEMERDFITFVDTEKAEGKSEAVVATIAAVKALRLQQICSGYVTTEDGVAVEMASNPRLDLVKELLKEIVVEGKNSIILWCSFKQNYKQLSRVCKELKIEHDFITGEQNLAQKTTSMEAFNSGKIPVIICNRRAGGIGINLVKANYSLVYSRNFSLGEELQSSARNYRGGSQIHDTIFKIDIAATDTVDELVMEALSIKRDISNQIIDLVKEVESDNVKRVR